MGRAACTFCSSSYRIVFLMIFFVSNHDLKLTFQIYFNFLISGSCRICRRERRRRVHERREGVRRFYDARLLVCHPTYQG